MELFFSRTSRAPGETKRLPKYLSAQYIRSRCMKTVHQSVRVHDIENCQFTSSENRPMIKLLRICIRSYPILQHLDKNTAGLWYHINTGF